MLCAHKCASHLCCATVDNGYSQLAAAAAAAKQHEQCAHEVYTGVDDNDYITMKSTKTAVFDPTRVKEMTVSIERLSAHYCKL
jgi:hypothetical protein